MNAVRCVLSLFKFVSCKQSETVVSRIPVWDTVVPSIAYEGVSISKLQLFMSLDSMQWKQIFNNNLNVSHDIVVCELCYLSGFTVV